MPKKRRTAGGAKETLLPQEQSREITRIHQEDDEFRPSVRAYAYVDPEAYTESPPARVATSYKCIRQGIALIFEHAPHTPPAEDWKELKTISFIFIQVCTDVLYCQDNGIFHSGEGNYSTTAGSPPIITFNTIETEVIADSIESGNSVQMSTVIVDKYRKKMELPSFTYSAVRGYSEEGETRFKNQGRCLVPCFVPMLDPTGQYAASDKSFLQVTYKREAHFNLGVFMTDDEKGHRVDDIFKYIEKKLVPRLKREKLRLQVIAYAKTQKGAINGNESVQQIPKLKWKTFEKLQQHGLVLVPIAAAAPVISFNRLSGFANAAAVCLEGDPRQYLTIPKLTTHRKACIEAGGNRRKLTKSNVFGDKGFVYHDTLMLMTCADSVLYMKEKGFYKHWIFPELDLMGEQGGMGGSLKLYRNRPVGNQPEANPLDTSLFSELNHAVDQHVMLIQGFLNQNKKFSVGTPGAVSRTYHCVWTLQSKSETIVKDINEVLCSFLEVAEVEGIVIDGIGNRPGKRHLPWGQHEGRGVWKLDNNCYDKGEIKLHADAEPAGDLIFEKAEAKFNLNL
eukprot:jgi/Psemu1/32888/gm1.32888_g